MEREFSNRLFLDISRIKFICEIQKGREKHATAALFEIPDSSIQSILTRAETNYDIPFDKDQ